MFNKKILLSLLALVFSVALLSTNDAYSQTKPTVSVSTNKKSYKPGDTGILIVKFKTASGVKIPKVPNIKITINSGVDGSGIQDYSGNGAGEYLGNNTVKYNFKVPSNASGNVTIGGTVKYGYCNANDGICKMGSTNFSKSISVK